MKFEEYIANLLVAVTKKAGGTLFISNLWLDNEPHEAVKVEPSEEGITLTITSRLVLEAEIEHNRELEEEHRNV